jgi:hypothetical protein
VTNSVDRSSYVRLTNSSVRCARCNLDVSRLATSYCCCCRFSAVDGCSRCVCPAKRTTTAERFPSLRRARAIYYFPNKRYNIFNLSLTLSLFLSHSILLTRSLSRLTPIFQYSVRTGFKTYIIHFVRTAWTRINWCTRECARDAKHSKIIDESSMFIFEPKSTLFEVDCFHVYNNEFNLVRNGINKTLIVVSK